MLRREIVLGFLLCLCLSRRSRAADTWVIREDGVGPVKVGMTLSELNRVLHEKFSMPPDKSDQGCFYVNPQEHPHVSFMIEDSRLARVDVENSGVFTSTGIEVGASEAHTRSVYGSLLKVEPQHYTDGHYLTTRSSDGHYGIRFETDQGKVTAFYAGRYEAIQYVEGCD